MEKEAIQTKDLASEGLPALLGKMADDLTQLFDAKLTLLRIELREEIAAYIRGTAMLVVGAVIALVGFAILNVAFAFLVSRLFANADISDPVRYALGFGITALIYLATGAAIIVINKNKLAEQRLVPQRTIAELKRDKDRLEKEI